MKWFILAALWWADGALASANAAPFEALMFYYAYQVDVTSILAENHATQLTEAMRNTLSIGKCLGTLPDKSCDINEFLEYTVQGNPKDLTSAGGVKYPDVDATAVHLYNTNANLNFRLYKIIPGETAWPSNNGRPNMADAVKQMVNSVQIERARPSAGTWSGGAAISGLQTAIDRSNLWRRADNAPILIQEIQSYLNNRNNPAHVLTLATRNIVIPQSAGGITFQEPDMDATVAGVSNAAAVSDFETNVPGGLSDSTVVHLKLINLLSNAKTVVRGGCTAGIP
ncbi:hypothetical protein GQ53DRAFT_821517 [Thozetella sp. PMI_491]|nr:hypothetical protein GQ53DRAFT_821517 [Thozetella sp. PMI_491]